MRGTFALVLAAGVVAAVGWSVVRRGAGGGAEPDDSDGPIVRSADPAPPPSPPGTTPAIAPAPRGEPQSSLVARVDQQLANGDPVAAARMILAAEAQVLRDALLRERAFKVAAALEARASQVPDAQGTVQRVDARRLLSALYDCESASAQEHARAFEDCARLHQALLFGNGAPDTLVYRHKIEPGDNVWTLSKGPWRQRGVSVAPGFVLHVNGIGDPRRLRAGATLRVPLEPMRLLVRKSRFELAVLLGGAPVERFAIGIGSGGSTPSGSFQVKDRLKEPDWYFHGRRIPYGDPENIIGTRWLGLAGAPTADGIGIHGTTDDTSIGKAVSMGCVRMRNGDVERLFEWVAAGTEVEIRD